MRAALGCLALMVLLAACDPSPPPRATDESAPSKSEAAANPETPKSENPPAAARKGHCRDVAPGDDDTSDNQGITARLCVSDRTPKVGTPVVFTVDARDPDARLRGLTNCAPNQLTFGDEKLNCSGGPGCAAGGSRPPKQAGQFSDEVNHVYKRIGRFTASLELQSGSQCPHPYASTATVKLRVVVHK